MMSYNYCSLIGNITADSLLSYISTGTPVCKFRIAVNRQWVSKENERKYFNNEVSFFNIVVWGKLGESCAKYLKKGKSVFVDGRLKQESWEKDGQKHSRITIIANQVIFLSPPTAEGDQVNSGPAPIKQPITEPPADQEEPEEEILPF